MVAAAFAEVVSIGAVLPFLAVLTDPEPVFRHPFLQPVIGVLGLTEPTQLLLPLTILFGTAALLSGGMRLLLLWVSTRLSFATGADLGIDIYQRTLYQPYSVHVSRNSSSVITGISTKANAVIFFVITPLLTLLSSGVILAVVVVGMLSFSPVVALSAFGGFGLIYAVIIRLTQGRMAKNSASVAHESTQVVKSLQEGLGGIRDVLIDGTQQAYCNVYRTADLALRRAQGSSQFIGQSPRFIMESLGMLLISALAFALAQQASGVAKVIPVLGALALGAQRMLPVLQQAYAAWSGIMGNQASLADTLALLDQPLPCHAGRSEEKPLPFNEHITIGDLSFRYSPDGPWVLRHVDLSIPKGSRIGFIGSTGSGKSTLLDLLMALLEPTEGILAIDGAQVTTVNQRQWQAHIAHVPQAIFLADTSIEENIAFGIPKKEIDHERVRTAAKQAQIHDIIESWPKQYKTFVGERGIRLSGGQRQRIGIARALYKQADVIIFDEATSALDNATESAVMQAIEELHEDLTVLIIAHRLTTLRNCDMIVELAGGNVKAVGTYEEIVSNRNGLSQPAASKTPTTC
jgi:ATP-binding cassette subfamily B protein